MLQITDIDNINDAKRDLKDYSHNTNQSESNTKTKFQIECETAISLDEAEVRLLSFVRNLPWKK